MKIRLLKPHEHRGIFLLPGETLELDDDLAEWLSRIGTAAPLSGRPEKSTPSPTTPQEEKSK